VPRTLIAGFGNVLRGDDGFGVEVVRRLGRLREYADQDVALLEVGTGGIHLAQELLSGYDRLIIVDAMSRGGAPGSVYVLEVDDVEPAPSVDMHLAIPASALSVAKALGALPPRVFLVGCEPAEVDELSTELTTPVRAAVDAAVRRVCELVGRDGAGGVTTDGAQVEGR
jgi:hydrogenase maturation protease